MPFEIIALPALACLLWGVIRGLQARPAPEPEDESYLF
jgi:hypothetical protein